MLRADAPASEQRRRLTNTSVAALTQAGLFRLLVPAVYGGPEVDPLTLLETIEIVAEADGAAGWCVNIASTTASMSWYLRPDWARTIYGDPAVVTGGSFTPNGKGVATDGGWSVNGSWPWGSGTQHCQWVNAGVRTDTGQFNLMFFPQADVDYLDTWHSAGLAGTGSTDFAVHDAFVPDGASLQPGVTKTTLDAPLCHFPNFSLLAAGLAAVTLGIARRAIAELVELAATKRPALSSRPLAEAPFVQMDLARAEARYRSARAFIHDEVAKTWATVQAGGRVSVADRASIRLAAANAAASAAEAVDLCFSAAGGSAVYAASPLQRCLRDVHVATQHQMLSARNSEVFARVRLGLEADTAML